MQQSNQWSKNKRNVGNKRKDRYKEATKIENFKRKTTNNKDSRMTINVRKDR